MSDLEIPLPTDTPLFSIRTTLDGVEYVLNFDWNGRESRWYMSISMIDGTLLVAGIKLISNWPLLRRFADLRLPQGNLRAVDYSPQGGEPAGLVEDLGRRVKLIYTPTS